MWPFASTSASKVEQLSDDAVSACPMHQGNVDRSRKASRDPVTGLSTEREISSIPRLRTASASSSACPHATVEPDQDEKWVYPSPSSFYTALERKNRNPSKRDMDIVVPIHNAVNERCWQQVLDWEREALARQGRDPAQVDNVKLVSFKGRPKDLSPRARWKSWIGYSPPFDRHDWTVSRPQGEEGDVRIRYVIDFYTGRGAGLLDHEQQQQQQHPDETASSSVMSRPNLAFFIDCRPALDGVEEVKMRSYRWYNTWFGSSSSS